MNKDKIYSLLEKLPEQLFVSGNFFEEAYKNCDGKNKGFIKESIALRYEYLQATKKFEKNSSYQISNINWTNNYTSYQIACICLTNKTPISFLLDMAISAISAGCLVTSFFLLSEDSNNIAGELLLVQELLGIEYSFKGNELELIELLKFFDKEKLNTKKICLDTEEKLNMICNSVKYSDIGFYYTELDNWNLEKLRWLFENLEVFVSDKTPDFLLDIIPNVKIISEKEFLNKHFNILYSSVDIAKFELRLTPCYELMGFYLDHFFWIQKSLIFDNKIQNKI